MNNNNTDPTPGPSPTREGNGYRQTIRMALPSLVGEGLGVGSVLGSAAWLVQEL